MRLAAISVDLDEIPFYYQIHGLTPPEGGAATAVYDRALDRLQGMSSALGVPLTLFAIGENLERPESAAKLRAMAGAGHEIANHTFGHRYRLTRLEPGAMAHEVRAGIASIERATGVRPVGFRAPGYTITDQLFECLRDAGVLYDSSVFPSPSYYALKAAAIGAIALRKRRSHSVIDTPNMLRAPTRPYRIGVPYWTEGDGLLELPIQVTRGLRLPFIGTAVTAAGPTGAKLLTRMVVGEPLVNLELHGIDVLDPEDGLAGLDRYQHDVRIPAARKLAAIAAVIETLRVAGYAFVRLDEAAREVLRKSASSNVDHVGCAV